MRQSKNFVGMVVFKDQNLKSSSALIERAGWTTLLHDEQTMPIFLFGLILFNPFFFFFSFNKADYKLDVDG